MKQRLDSLDITKAFCILAVLILHILAFRPSAAVIALMLGSSMLVFFLAAGYTYKPGRGAKQNIIIRAKRLLIPFAAYSIVINLIYAVTSVCSGTVSVSGALLNAQRYYLAGPARELVQGDYTLSCLMPYWFLLIMFVASVVFYLIADFALASGKRTAGLILVLLSITAILKETIDLQLPWHLEIVPAFSAILLIGAYAGKMQLLSKLQWQGKKSVLLIAATAVVTLILSIFCGTAVLVSENNWGNFGGFSVYIAVVQGIVAAVMLVLISEAIARTKKLKQVMVWLGKHSMEFYVIHMFFAYYISKVTGWKFLAIDREPATSPLEICQTFLLFALTMLLCTLWTFGYQAIAGRIRKKKPTAPNR